MLGWLVCWVGVMGGCWHARLLARKRMGSLVCHVWVDGGAAWPLGLLANWLASCLDCSLLGRMNNRGNHRTCLVGYTVVLVCKYTSLR